MTLTCPVCDCPQLETGRCGLSTCEQCTHTFQTDLNVTADYAGDYGARTYDTYPQDTSVLRAGYAIGRTALGAGASVLDVGYGNGSFLTTMKSLGFLTYGHDVHCRLDGITRGTVDARYDLITFFDSLEHLPSLRLPLNVRHCIVSIPHRPTWFLADPPRWRHFKPGEHLHYFTPRSLALLMEMRGLHCKHSVPLEDIIRTPQKGVSVNIMTYHFER